MGWVRRHLEWIVGGVIAAIVAWYLVMRPKGAGAPTTVSFPPSTGGGAGDTGAGSSGGSPQALTSQLVYNELHQAWHTIAVSTGNPWSYDMWAQGIRALLPVGIAPNEGVLTYIWNSLNTTHTMTNAQATQFINDTINDWLLHPNKYPTNGTPIAPYIPKPVAVPSVRPQDLAIHPLTAKGRI